MAQNLARVEIKKVANSATGKYLSQGFVTLRKTYLPSFFFGLAIVFISWAIIGFLYMINFGTMVPAAIGGFIFTGPLIATVFYNLARESESHEIVNNFPKIKMAPYSRSQLGYIGFALFFVVISWAIFAHLIWSINVGLGKNIDESKFIEFIFTTTQGLSVLTFGLITGVLLGGFCFAVSAISLPMVFDKDIDAISAMALSVKACFINPIPMIYWAIFIAICVGFSALFFFVPLIVIFPYLGHVTWQLYKDIAQ